MHTLFKVIVSVGYLVMLVSGITHAGEKVILATSEWIPYTSETEEGGGVVIEIISAAFKEAGIEVEYQFLPWLRGEKYVKRGDVYAIFPYVKTDERNTTYQFSDPLIRATQKFFYLKRRITSEVRWERYEDLKAYTIGGTFGFWYLPVFKAAGLNVDASSDDRLGIQKLYSGRFDLFAVDELNGWAIIKTLYPNEVARFGSTNQVLKADYYRLMISRKYPHAESITPQFNAALKRIKKNGVYSAILNKYNISE